MIIIFITKLLFCWTNSWSIKKIAKRRRIQKNFLDGSFFSSPFAFSFDEKRGEHIWSVALDKKGNFHRYRVFPFPFSYPPLLRLSMFSFVFVLFLCSSCLMVENFCQRMNLKGFHGLNPFCNFAVSKFLRCSFCPLSKIYILYSTLFVENCFLRIILQCFVCLRVTALTKRVDRDSDYRMSHDKA